MAQDIPKINFINIYPYSYMTVDDFKKTYFYNKSMYKGGDDEGANLLDDNEILQAIDLATSYLVVITTDRIKIAYNAIVDITKPTPDEADFLGKLKYAIATTVDY